uniref:PX domain-containing protein n=1 Tax=Panagrellus redivivus TaxID=6233 RepID=A0A7E4VYV3_PANRE
MCLGAQPHIFLQTRLKTVNSSHFTPRLPVHSSIMSDYMATAFRFKDIVIRLFQLTDYPLLHEECLKLWPEFERFSKFCNHYLHLTIDYCQEVKEFKVWTLYRSYDDFFRVDEDTKMIPKSEFPDKFYLLYGKYLMAKVSNQRL